MLRDQDRFEGVYVSGDMAEQEADRLRAQQGRALTWHATSIRVARHEVLDFPVHEAARRSEAASAEAGQE